jgi:hypothetical protein
MHGIIFSELKRYTEARLGESGWREVLADAELGPRLYMAVQTYPDEEAVAIITAASARADLPLPALLQDFGEFITPTLLSMYRSLIKPEWKTLDVLENTEQTIHTVVRLRNPGAVPAVLEARRDSPDELTLTYSSARQLCQLAVGIIKGLAAHYGEQATIDQVACMHNGAETCVFSIRTSPSPAVLSAAGASVS